MSRFFFHFRQGSAFAFDDEGCEFASTELAYLGAFQAAQEMWRELLIKRQDPMLCAFEVLDQDGNDIFILPFSEVLDACRGRTPTLPRFNHRHMMTETVARQRHAHKAMDDVSLALTRTKATLRETLDLIEQVNKAASS